MFKKFVITFVVAIIVSLSPAPTQAMATSSTLTISVASVDGINKKKVRKTSSRRAKKKAPTVATVCTLPIVEIFASIGSTQAIANFPCGSPITQSARKQGNAAVPLNKDGTVAAQFTNPKDQEIAERIINSLKPDHFSFLVIPANSRSMGKSTIALEKSSWSEEDIELLRKLIAEAFAPATPNFLSKFDRTQKRFELPRFDVALNPSKP